ncbi:hypothetical protein HXA34_20695 [Salipaludibacillus agaradhaerens]|jgi:hypothetical protein|uniref:hypothetical protein n=1 Tax=Salipaludibacillus agaradhaerens TaxID=76935 RepID=UPI002150A25F|nr:hypothetical protein [Salipaludibacillus agaradhaerens]MCR6108719.1 hypothetical protein [Salipaludibacillus agaradhaerens]MCR6120742.1 hypothetical protein [Salipaludibacillus agaradhaerens]
MAEHTGAIKDVTSLTTSEKFSGKPSGSKKRSEIRLRKTERHNMRMYPEDYNYLSYWSDRFGMDQTDFLINAMYHYVKWRNQDYELPTAEIQRLNQMIDAVQNLAVNQQHLEKSVVNGFDAMLGIIRGDNYLVEDEDGDLS